MPKGRLSQCERRPFGVQNVAFCRRVCNVLTVSWLRMGSHWRCCGIRNVCRCLSIYVYPVFVYAACAAVYVAGQVFKCAYFVFRSHVDNEQVGRGLARRGAPIG